MYLPTELTPILADFAPAFTKATYQKAVVLMTGTLLAKGRRTVTAALRAVGLQNEPGWSKYHHVLNRATWSGLNVSTSGLRWLVFAVVVHLPWSRCAWSLPFLSILLTSPNVSTKLGKRHQTVAQRTGEVVGWVRRMLPGRPIQLVGDGAYSVILLGLRCQQQGVSLLAPLRLDARLFDHPSLVAGKRLQGRPAVVGQRLPLLPQFAQQLTTRWQRGWIRWYGGTNKRLDWATGKALWYSTGTTPLYIRWVLVRAPLGELPLRAYFSTDTHQSAHMMIEGVALCLSNHHRSGNQSVFNQRPEQNHGYIASSHAPVVS